MCVRLCAGAGCTASWAEGCFVQAWGTSSSSFPQQLITGCSIGSPATTCTRACGATVCRENASRTTTASVRLRAEGWGGPATGPWESSSDCWGARVRGGGGGSLSNNDVEALAASQNTYTWNMIGTRALAEVTCAPSPSSWWGGNIRSSASTRISIQPFSFE